MTAVQIGLRDLPIIGTFENGGGALRQHWIRDLATPTLRAAGPGGTAYRRRITRDPLLFALTYLPHHLTMAMEGGKLISFSPWHVEAFDRMGAWEAFGGPQRHATFAPRKGAKTTIYYVVGILYGIAHAGLRFPLALSNNSSQVETHLAKVATELTSNPYGLLDDFPELRLVRNSARDLVTTDGIQISARGMDAQALGISSATNDRPDLILLDDIEPDAEHYSMGGKGKRLGTLLNAILPMNEDAIVEWTGTVTMYGSMAHDLVLAAHGERLAGWVEETRFSADHYPAILDEGLPSMRSLWPQRWPLTDLLRMKYPRWPETKVVSRAFALNYDNRPESAGGLYWTRDLIRHTPTAVSQAYLLSIDTAVTNGPAADMTALTIMGQAPDGRHLTVEWTWAGRITGITLRDLVHDLLRENPTLRDILIEGNQGGERWLDILSPPEKPLPGGVNVPGGITVTIGRPEKRGSKRNRLEWLLAQYELDLIGHRQRFAELEDQMLAWPKVAHDDLMDTVEAAASYFLGRPVK